MLLNLKAPYKNSFSSEQSGFALASVLIILLVLGVVVSSFILNQSALLKETAVVFTSAKAEQDSHNQHRACLAIVRNSLKEVYPAGPYKAEVDLTASNPILTAQNCTVLAAGLAGSHEWTPLLKITTVLNGVVEVSEWQYKSCADFGSICVQGGNLLKINSDCGVLTLNPSFSKNSVVQTVWRRERLQAPASAPSPVVSSCASTGAV